MEQAVRSGENKKMLPRMRKWVRGQWFAIAIAACGVGLVVTPLGERLEKGLGLSWLFEIRGGVEAPADVVVVGINSSSGKAMDLPRLPREWPRTLHAQMIERLVDYGASVIVFDFDFSKVKSGYEEIVFARAISKSQRTVLYERLDGKRQPIYRADGSTSGWVWVEEVVPPNSVLAGAARALAPFPLPKLEDSAFQFWTFKPSAGDVPTVAASALQLHALGGYDAWLSTLRAAGATGIEELPTSADAIEEPETLRQVMLSLLDAFRADPGLRGRVEEAIELSDFYKNDARQRRYAHALAGLYGGLEDRFLNFYGAPGSIKTIPYHALASEDYDGPEPKREDFEGKVVFVGYSDLFEPDQPDRFYTVFTGEDGVDLSGVEIMATAFANLLTDRTVRPSTPLVTVAVVLAFGFAIAIAIYLLPALAGVPLVIALAALYGFGALWAFSEMDYWLPLAVPMVVQLPLALLGGLMAQYLLERRLERKYSQAISYYLPENIVRDLTESKIDPSALNKVVYGTCLATDMSGFSTIAEHKTPEELATFMNAYFDALAEPLKRHAADVTEFHADTIMCAWTGSEEDPAVREKPILAAIDVVEAIRKFAAADRGPRLSARIGLQDGMFFLGHTGGGGRLAYSILGDPANTASRLEGLNKHLKTQLLAAETVVRNSNGALLRPLGSFQLVGKAEATAVVEILGRKESAEAEIVDLCERFSEALGTFLMRDWERAEAAFRAVLDRYPDDGPSALYLRLCEDYLRGEIPNEDPTVVYMTSK